MELKRIIFFLGIFMFCSCSRPSSGLNESIAVMVKNDSDIERVYSKLQGVMVQADGRLEFKNDNYSFSDEKWNSYDAKSDMIKRQRNLYRVIHFTNLETSDFLEIRFYQTDGMDVEINIFYSEPSSTSVKLL